MAEDIRLSVVGDGGGRRKRGGKPPKRGFGKYIVMSLLLIGIVCVGVYMAPSFQQMDWVSYHEAYSKDAPVVVLNDAAQPPEVKPVVQDGVLYLPVGFVREAIDSTLFWDGQANRLTVTTPTRLIQMRTDELTYYVNNEKLSLPLSALQVDGEAYMPSGLLMDLYHVDIVLHEETGMATVDDLSVSRQLGTANEKAVLRFEPDAKSPILRRLKADAPLVLYAEADGWWHVRTADGLLGYIHAPKVTATEIEEGTAAPQSESVSPPEIASGGKITLLWDQIYNMTASTNAARRVAYPGLDVISPTWFSFDFDAMNGDIISLADQGYVNWAHANGIQVWALFTDDFRQSVARDILSDTNKREHVVHQLLALAATYRLDGINIDFENVKLADVAHYHQFLRELAPLLRQQGVVLSVDMYVPMPYSMYYDRAEVARVADYVIVMAYDEHNADSVEAGPVASIGFVKNGITGTLAEVDESQLILGVPFYVRRWKEAETPEGIELSTEAWSMDRTWKFFADKNAEIVWKDDAGCYYSEYKTVEDGVNVTYSAWLEDERSMEERLLLVEEYDLAGVAGWSKGLESDGIWDLMNQYLE